jgi:hypothetical protein
VTISVVLATVWVVAAVIALPPAIYSTLIPIGGWVLPISNTIMVT